MASQLRARGWSVDTQVGVGKYRVDLGIRDPENNGRYLAGIECDGATYHSAEWARDRDIVRQQVLERLGWRFYRVWSPDWFRDRQVALRDLEQFLLASKAVDSNLDAAPAAANSDDDTVDTPAFIAAPGLPQGALEFRPHLISRPSGPLSGHVAQIVRQEGPLHREELMAALRDDLGYGRVGSTIRQQLTSAISNAIHRGEVIERGEWIWPSGMDVSNVPVRVSSKTRRKFEYYANEELVRAMFLSCETSGRLTRQQLIEATASLLGYNLTIAVRERLSSVVDAIAIPGLKHHPDGTFEVENRAV